MSDLGGDGHREHLSSAKGAAVTDPERGLRTRHPRQMVAVYGFACEYRPRGLWHRFLIWREARRG